ncbi:hypothetical protein MMC28_010043 [Mycoblastus sanguinarius]|nr:hypothetical protein [Mycoblastus sanguinarius]
MAQPNTRVPPLKLSQSTPPPPQGVRTANATNKGYVGGASPTASDAPLPSRPTSPNPRVDHIGEEPDNFKSPPPPPPPPAAAAASGVLPASKGNSKAQPPISGAGSSPKQSAIASPLGTGKSTATSPSPGLREHLGRLAASMARDAIMAKPAAAPTET